MRQRNLVAIGVGVISAAAGLSLLVVALASAGEKAAPPGHWGLDLLATHRPQDAVPAPSAKGALILNESEAQVSFLDLGPSGESVGDEIVIHGPLYERTLTSVVGHIDVTCTLSFDASLCDATADLPGRGELRFGGPAGSNSFLFAITGGTNAFRTARGQVLVESGVPSNNLDRLMLQVVD
jgi:hypothetical protein